MKPVPRRIIQIDDEIGSFINLSLWSELECIKKHPVLSGIGQMLSINGIQKTQANFKCSLWNLI